MAWTHLPAAAQHGHKTSKLTCFHHIQHVMDRIPAQPYLSSLRSTLPWAPYSTCSKAKDSRGGRGTASTARGGKR